MFFVKLDNIVAFIFWDAVLPRNTWNHETILARLYLFVCKRTIFFQRKITRTNIPKLFVNVFRIFTATIRNCFFVSFWIIRGNVFIFFFCQQNRHSSLWFRV